MRILLDECVHAGVREAFRGHEVHTVQELGWESTRDSELLRKAEKRFDVLVTIDRNLEFQQPLARFQLGFVIVRVRRNEMPYYRPLFDSMLAAVTEAARGLVVHVG